MKQFFTAFMMTQSMFCAIPCPWKNWDEKARPYMLLFLPVVGLEIGFLWIVLDWGLRGLGIPPMLYGLVMTMLPYLLTGFIHMDGFLDVTDAVCSWRDLIRRREILKDSHVGSFAVIWCVFLILAGFCGFCTIAEMTETTGFRISLLMVPVLSRCCSAVAVLKLKSMSTSQYSGNQTAPGWVVPVLVTVAAVCVLLTGMLAGRWIPVAVATLAGYGAALRRGYRSLEGMNGDISGYCITVSEVCAVVMLAVL